MKIVDTKGSEGSSSFSDGISAIVVKLTVGQFDKPLAQLPRGVGFPLLPPRECCRVNTESLSHLSLAQPVVQAVGLNRFIDRRLLNSGEWTIPDELDYLGEQVNSWVASVPFPVIDGGGVDTEVSCHVLLEKSDVKPFFADVVAQRSQRNRICPGRGYFGRKCHMAFEQRIPVVA